MSADSQTSDVRSSKMPKPLRFRESRWARKNVILVLIVVFLAVFTLPYELEKWRVASIEEQMEAGKYDQAVESINSALERSPKSGVLYLLRARAQVYSSGNADIDKLQAALSDVNQALELSPNLFRAYLDRGQIRLQLGHFVEAVEDYDVFVEKITDYGNLSRVQAQKEYANVLNSRAYTCALANIRIQASIEDINKAIEILRRLKEPESPAFLDTRGYLYHLAGEKEKARVDMEKVIDLTEKKMAETALIVTSDTHRPSWLIQAQESLAVLYYHRSLVYESLQFDEAKSDLEKARQLGYQDGDF